MTEEEKTIAENIIRVGVEQIEHSCRISMDYNLLNKVHEAAQSMRLALFLRGEIETTVSV